VWFASIGLQATVQPLCFAHHAPLDSWAKLQKPAKKWDFKKVVKLTDHNCACNDLTNFECEAQATGNGSCEIFQKLEWKISWNHLGWTYFLAGFRCLEPLCAGFAAAQTWENFWTLMHSYLQTRNGWVCALIFIQAVTVATDELLCDKNAGKLVSMVSYLKKISKNCNIKERKKTLGAA
jgi:hypothetical protein